MATEKILNTRVQLKYDSYENWIATANQFKLRPGEVAVVNINGANGANLNNGVENTVVQPTILFKVGIGNPADDATWKTFNQLPWASALAADVHTWAKKSLDEFTAWVAKTPKTVTLSVNGENTDYTIEEAIKLVRNEITAGGEAAAITIADESTDGKIKYTAKQGGTAIVESIEVNEGKGIEITVEGNVPKISHQTKPTTGNVAEVKTGGTGRTYVTEVLVDDLGHIAGVKTASESDQEIDWETEVPAHETLLKITDKPTAALEDGLVYAVTNLEEGGINGHDVTATYEAVATKAYVDKRASGAVDYLGTASSLTTLSTTAGKGDFYRAAAEIKSGDTVLAHAGDLIIAEKDKPAQQIDGVNWSVIHGEEGDITEIVAGDGLTGGGSVDSVTIEHEVPTGATEGDHKGTQSRTYVTNVKTDKFGHVVGFETGTEEDQEVGVTSVNASGDSEITLTANPTTGDVIITGAHAPHAAGTAKTASTGSISGYSATGSIKIPKIVTNAAGHVTEISEETVSIQMPAPQELPTVNDGQLTVTGSEGITVDYQTPFSANTADEHFLGLKIADKGVTTEKIADHAVGAHQTKACTDYSGADAEVWVFNCGSATVNVGE